MDGKRIGWLVLVFGGAVLLGLWYLNYRAAREQGKRQPQPPGPTTATASAPATVPATVPASRPSATRPAATQPAGAPPPVTARRDQWKQDTSGLGRRNKFVVGSLNPESGYLFQVEFVREGAAVHTIKLAEHFATVEDKLLYKRLKRNHAAYEQARKKNPKTYRGHYSLLNPVGRSRPYATRSITVDVTGSRSEPTTIRLDAIRWRHVHTQDVTEPAAGKEIRFAATLWRDVHHDQPAKPADYRPHLRLTKTYTVPRDDYSIRMRLHVENLTKSEMKFSLDQLGATGVPREELRRGDDRLAAYGKLNPKDDVVGVILKPGREIQGASEQDGRRVYELPSHEPIVVGLSDEAEATLWIGHVNKYFASMLYLEPAMAVKGRRSAPTLQADFYASPVPETAASRTFVTGLRIGMRRRVRRGSYLPDLALRPAGSGGEVKELAFDIFAGPKKRDMFSDSGAERFRQLYKDLNYRDTIDFGGCCTWSPLSFGMMWLLQKISIVTLGNYGVAIMILVVLVRVVLHPLTKRSQVNMMKMQKLQPEMERIRKKYANDKEGMQKEMMQFYKQQGATPLLGCLPMFLQMPIWIALYTSLYAAVELRHSAFLPVWITDLAGPDALIEWQAQVTIPLIGGMVGPVTSLNLLPILLTVAMFLQTKLNPQMSQPTAAATPEQQKQQKMMRIMMPAMMLLFFYNAPAGLNLYIMTSTFAGVAEQYVIRRHIRAREAAEAAVTTTVKAPGRGPRGSRPKKPKGPFFTKHG